LAKAFDIQPTHLPEIKIIIADERKLFRQGLISLFATELGILVVGDTGDGIEAVKLASAKKPDVVVLNLHLASLNGVGAAKRMRKGAHQPDFVFLSTHHNELLMKEAFALGARAYLIMSCDFKELVFAIRKVAAGDYYLTGPAGRDMALEYIGAATPPEDSAVNILTHSEQEVCRLLADGLSTKEVAGRLHISSRTAETHRASVMKKIRGKNVTDIVKFCIRNGIIRI
jgi:DNA-binding NarL/FixJ family response regulator